MRQIPSILLLGAGEGGKSTIYKQIQQIYHREFDSIENRIPYISIVHHNLIISMYNIVCYIRRIWQFIMKKYNKEFTFQIGLNSDLYSEVEVSNDPYQPELYNLITNISEQTRNSFLILCQFDHFEKRLQCRLTSELIDCIDHLWNREPLIRFIYKHYRHEKYQLHESAEYWFNNLNRIAKLDYIPTVEDIMKVRVKTTGILQTQIFEEQYERSLNMVLMGSQRSERKKWLRIIRERKLGAVIFVVALSEYNQTLYENETTNRLHESICIFSEMMNSPLLQGAPVYLFLNKSDIFVEKLSEYSHSDLSIVFPELPEHLRKKYIQDRGIYLIPKTFSSCCFVDWQELSNGMKSQPMNRESKIKLSINIRNAVEKRLAAYVQPSTDMNTLKTANEIYRSRKLIDLSSDEIGCICSFLNCKSLCCLSQVNRYMHTITGQDYIWRHLYFKTVIGSYPHLQGKLEVSEEIVDQIYQEEKINNPDVNVRIEKWKCFVKYASQTFYTENIRYILEKLLQTTDKRDIKVYITNASDFNGIAQILKSIIPEIAAKSLEIVETGHSTLVDLPQTASVSSKKKPPMLFAKIKNLFQ